MARHQASLSRPESPKNLCNNEETRSLYDEDTRSLHNEDTRSLKEETQSLYNDDLPRLRYKQRLQQPAYARQTSLNVDERKGNAGSRHYKSGYRTISSTKTHSSTQEIDTGQAFQETKSNLRNSQIFLDDNYNRGSNVDTRNYALRDDLPEINTQQYPSISGNSTYSLPRNARLYNSDRRYVESRRDESLRESQEDLYRSSQPHPYNESRETLLRRYPSSSLSRDSTPMAATQMLRQTPIESYHDGSTIYINSHPESYNRSPGASNPHNSYLDAEPSHRQKYSNGHEGSVRRLAQPDSYEYESNSSARSSRRSSPNRQTTPSHNFQQHPSYQRGYSTNPGLNGVPFHTTSSRRSSRGASPNHSTHSSRPASPASSTRSNRGGSRPINLPINPSSEGRCQSCCSHASSTRSSRATSPISNHSDWRVESLNNAPQNDSQNINSQIQQFLISSGQESNGASEVIYVRETFKIVNQNDHNSNREQGHPGSFQYIDNKASTPTSVRESSVGSVRSSNNLTEEGPKQYSNFVKDIQTEANSPGDPFKTFTGITRDRLRSSTPVKSSENKYESSLEGKQKKGSDEQDNEDISFKNSRDMVKSENDCINLATAHINQSTESHQNISKSDVKHSKFNEESSKDIIEEANNTCDENNLEEEDSYQFLQQKEIDNPLDNVRKRIDKGINVNVHESLKQLVEDDCRSIGTQDSFTSITLDKSSLDLATSNLSTTERSSLEKLLDSLSRRVREIEGEREIVDQRVADLADVDDSARAESVTSLVSSTSSKGRQERSNQEQNNREGDVEVHSTIRRQSVIINGLSLETEELRRKCQQLENELGTHGTTTPVVEDLSHKLELVEGKLEESESYCYQVIEENVELKSEMENLEAEISEVQDSFRDKDAKEFKKVKWELENLSKTCRNLQIKLGKAQAKASRLRNEKEEIEERSKEQAFWKTTAVVAAAALATYSVLSRLK